MAYTDDDSSRLPAGFQRVGYDANTQVYTFKSPDGRLYESAPGNRYGELWPVGQRPELSDSEIEANNAAIQEGNEQSVRMFMPFILVVFVVLLLVFYAIN